METAEPSQDQLLQSNQPQKPPKNSIKFKTILFTIGFLGTIPLFIVFVLLFSLALKYEGNGYVSRQVHSPQFQALPSQSNTIEVSVGNSDARIQALEDLFAYYNSPLQGHAKTIVEEADKNNIDYRLLPSIAMQESTLCKKVIKDSYNCWGFGIYSGKVRRFAGYDEAIKVISSTLSKKYIQEGYISPSEIVQKYTPSDTGKWPSVVSHMMQKITNSL